jgi:hypothetical protein
MKKLSILLVVSLFLLTPVLILPVMAQQAGENSQAPPVFNAPDQPPRSLPATGSAPPQTSLADNYQSLLVNPKENSFTARRTQSFTDKQPINDSLTDFVRGIAAPNRKKLTLAGGGMMMDSGLSYSVPMGQSFSAFAAFQPAFSDAFVTAPHTMWTAGLQVPLTQKTATGQDLALKFATTMDTQYRPVFFFSLNLMNLGRK